jgi:hypothetical protein
MVLEIGRAISFLLSLLSLYPVLLSAFFVPGSSWRERMMLALARVALSACICLASGMLFCAARSEECDSSPRLMETLPVRLFLCGIGGMIVLFFLSWYLEAYYLPLARRG